MVGQVWSTGGGMKGAGGEFPRHFALPCYVPLSKLKYFIVSFLDTRVQEYENDSS